MRLSPRKLRLLAGFVGADDLFALFEVAEELLALAEAAYHHLAVGGHFADYAKDGLEAEVEAFVHPLDGLFDLIRGEVGVAEGGRLDATVGEHDLVVEPAVGDSLIVKL